ncbi:MAG: hypothetical protein IAE78_21045 [Myxococcus sp.]|nr:hypothetical protein [Myxococcus sp.]
MRSWLLVVAVFVSSACEGPIAVVKFTTWGEGLIEEGIPASKFEDGWSVKFTKFLVVIRDITLVDAAGTVGSQQPGAKAFDLTKKGPVEVYSAAVPAKAWEVVRYAIAPDTNAEAANIDPTDLALVRSRTASVIVVGRATNGGVTKTFEWSFTNNTLLDDCQQAGGMGKGVVLAPGKEVTVQLTVHGDHLFYDQLGGDAKLRFEPLASSDLNGDDKVTLDEVAAVQLTSLPQGQYGTAGATNVRNLREFITQNMRTIGHYEGEGECTPKAR